MNIHKILSALNEDRTIDNQHANDKFSFINELNETKKLMEGRGDDLLVQFYGSIRAKYSHLEETEKLISGTSRLWADAKSDIQQAPNQWKFLLADALKRYAAEVFVKRLESIGKEDQKLKRIAEKPYYKVATEMASFPFVKAIITHASYLFDKPDIQRLDPMKFSNIEEFREAVRDIEDKYASDSQWVIPTGNEKLILDLGKFKWFDLGKGACKDEGSAMGHCGNVPSQQAGDTILSLRQVGTLNGNPAHRPSLTFILHGSGILGEMKGRANEKPSERYHRAIVELLKLPIIEGIKGGGYAPESNFSVEDLSPELYAELEQARGQEFMEGISGIKAIIKSIQQLDVDAANAYGKLNDILDNITEHIEETHGYDANPVYIRAVKSDNGATVEIDADNAFFDHLGNYADSVKRNEIYDIFIDVQYHGDVTDHYDEILPALSEGNGDLKDQFIMKFTEMYQTEIQEFADDNGDEITIGNNDESYDYVEENFDNICSEIDATEVDDMLRWALSDGERIGAESELSDAVYEVFSSMLVEFGLPVDRFNMWEVTESKDGIVVPKDLLKNFLINYVKTEGFHERDYELNEPYYGFSGFDESAYKERLRDLAHDFIHS